MTATIPTVSRDTVPVALIDPDPDQPRQYIDPSALAELSASIDANGLAVPILVRPVGDRYLLVHGERRWRAAASLGWTDIPAEVRDLDESSARWLQLVENLNRDDLSPIEEARAYRKMLDVGETQESIAARIGKTRTYIAQKLRLLTLPAPLTLLCDRGALSEGHIRQLLRIRRLYTDRHVVSRDTWNGTPESWAGVPLSELLVLSRPDDWPPGYPGIVGVAGQNPLLVEAGKVWAAEISAAVESGVGVGRWTFPAFYFAVLAVAAGASVATLNRLVDGWIERVYSAILHIRHGIRTSGRDAQVPPPEWRALGPGYRRAYALWHGHSSDLRHAGLDRDNDHLDLRTAARGAIQDGCVALPSNVYPGAPYHEQWQEIQAEYKELYER